MNNESIQQLSDVCSDGDGWIVRFAEYVVTHEVTRDLSVPNDDDDDDHDDDDDDDDDDNDNDNNDNLLI